MKLEVDDLYIDCSDLIKEANDLYKEALKKEIENSYLAYFESMNKYINSYTSYREKLLKTYIKDLKEIIKEGILE
jgi:hypothetical protein